MKKIIRSIVLAALLVAVMCSLTACGSKIEVDVSQYLNVKFSGIDGQGTAHADFDNADFEYEIMHQWKEDEKTFEKLGQLTALELSFNYELDKTEGLKNGDKVKISMTYNEEKAKEVGCKLSNTSKTITVEGLKEPISIDPFDPAQFSFTVEGVAPFAYVDDVRDRGVNGVTYEYENSSDLKNGDVITITATLDPQMAEREGYVLSRNEMTYTVEGLNMVPQNISDLTSDNIQQLKDICLETVENRSQSNVNVGNTSYYSMMMEPFDNIRLGSTGYLCVNRADVFFVVPVSITLNNVSEDYEVNGTFDVHGYVTVKGFMQSADGSLLTDTLYAETQGFSFNDGEALNNYLASFNADWVQSSGNIG